MGGDLGVTSKVGGVPDANKIECVKQNGVISSVLSSRTEYDENTVFLGFYNVEDSFTWRSCWTF